MRTVWKFELQTTEGISVNLGRFTINVPAKSNFIAAAIVNGVFTVWAEVTTSSSSQRRIYVIGNRSINTGRCSFCYSF